MTTEEKLKHFLDTCMEDARMRSSRMLEEYMAALENDFKEHQQEAQRRAGLQVRQETNQIERDMNKKLSLKQMELKRSLGRKQEELKERLFDQLKKKLEAYEKTPEYEKYLEGQIQKALDFARGEEIVIYLDPSDQSRQIELAGKFPAARFEISSYSFLGGIRGVLPMSNILMDHSFQKRLEELGEEFHFDFMSGIQNQKEGGKENAGNGSK